MEDTGLEFFSGRGLGALKKEIFTEEVGNLGDRQVTNKLLAVKTNKDGTKELDTLQKSDLSTKNWIKSFFFSDSPLANKDYHLENIVHYTKEKLDEALKKFEETDENCKKLTSVSEKIEYLKENNKLSLDDFKVLNNIYHIANRAHFYNHDNDGLFDAVSKTIRPEGSKNTQQNKAPLITVYQGESLNSTAIKGEFKWNPMMNIRFVALEALKEGKIRTFKPLAELNVQLEFVKGLAVPKNLNQVIEEGNLIKDGKAVCITFVESSGGDYIDECVLSANSPNLFKMYDSDTKVQAALRLFEKGEKIPYEALTTDEMIKLIDEKPKILDSIPEKFHESIIAKKPELLRLSEGFKKQFFEAEPKRIESLPPEFQKEILGSLKDHDIIKSIMPLAHEDAQIHIIEKFGDEKNGALHEHVSSPMIYAKILGDKPEELAKKSKIFQEKALINEENRKKYLKHASDDVQGNFLWDKEGKNFQFDNLPYVSSVLQMKQVIVGGIEKYFGEDPKRIALFPIDFQIALIDRVAGLDQWGVKDHWDIVKVLMPHTNEAVKKHFIEERDLKWSKNLEIIYYGLPSAFLELVEKDSYNVSRLSIPLQKDFLSSEDNRRKYLKDATGEVAKYFVKQNKDNIPYLNQFHRINYGLVDVEKLSEEELFKGFSELAFELMSCHQSQVYLGIIKQENILRDDEKKELVLSGFDEATEVTKPEDCTLQFPFTPYYICTQDTFELHDMVQKKDIHGYRNIREKMDVFALAVSMFTISTGGDLPCEYSDKGFAQDRISQETIIEKLKERFGDTEKTMRLGILIYMSLDPDHRQRPTSNEFDETMQEIAVM